MSSAKAIEAVTIRDAALVVLRRHGKPQTTGGKAPVRITAAELDGLNISHSTPFTPQPPIPEAMRQALAAAGKTPLPYDVNIWDNRKKVFLASWSDGDVEFRVTTFKRGPWAQRLADLADGPA